MKRIVLEKIKKRANLTNEHKRQRLEWCLANQNNNFRNYIFCDETSCWINAAPLYHWRNRSTYPDACEIWTSSRLKLNVWGAISCMGASEFLVNQIFN